MPALLPAQIQLYHHESRPIVNAMCKDEQVRFSGQFPDVDIDSDDWEGCEADISISGIIDWNDDGLMIWSMQLEMSNWDEECGGSLGQCTVTVSGEGFRP